MNLIKYGEKYFDELEIGIYRRREINAEIELNRISMATSSMRVVTIIRGILDRKLGLAVIEGDEEEHIKDGIENAAKMARINKRDDRWHSLPSPQVYREAFPVNKKVREIEPQMLIQTLMEGTGGIRDRDPHSMVAGGAAGSIYAERKIENSHGLESYLEDGGTYFYLYAVGKKNGFVTPGIFDMDVRRDTNLDVERVVDSISFKLQKAYNMVGAENEEATVVFEPFALQSILEYTLFFAIRGERKVKGTTPLADKLGEKVLHERITMMDDPWHPLSINKITADDEGVATRQLTLFENGIFKNFLWDNYWGNIEGTGSTGNGYRNLQTGAINIAPHNVVMLPGTKSVKDIISSISNGYLVSLFQGAHSSNPESGDFNVVANPAFKIEDGEIVGSTVFMVSGNIYSLLNKVEDISKEQRSIYGMGRGVFPTVSFHNVKIARVSR